MFKRSQLSLLIGLSLPLVLAGCEGDDGADGRDGRDLTAGTPILQQIGRFTDDANSFDESAAEIVAWDAASARLFVVNAEAGQLDVLDLSDPSSPSRIDTLDAADVWADAGGINSVAVANGLVAVAVENDSSTEAGRVQFYNAADLAFRSEVVVGVLPDMVTFTPDASRALVANEGEPNDDYSIDPEGSIAVIDVSDVDAPGVTLLDFADFNAGGSRADELPEGVRIFGNFGRTQAAVTAFGDTDPATLTLDDASAFVAGDWLTLASSEGDPLPYQVASVGGNVLTLTTDFDGDSEVAAATAAGLQVFRHDGASSVAQDLEPEYIAVAPDGQSAWVSLQENNAVALIDLSIPAIDRIIALGTKDHSIPGNELDVSDEDGGINIRNWPVRGMYMPDSLAAYEANGQTFYLSANEGDSREYDGFVEELAFEDAPKDAALLALDTSGNDVFNDDQGPGDLLTTLTNDRDGDGDLDQAHAFGARSFSIWSADGNQVFDSGNDFARITANRLGGNFNNDNDENDGDSRSDAKGAEPEALTTGSVNGRSYAFVGLERTGGILVYDISTPADARFVQYLNNRDFTFDIAGRLDDGNEPAHLAGDLGPEGMVFIPAEESPNGAPLLVVGSEVSGTTTVYRFD